MNVDGAEYLKSQDRLVVVKGLVIAELGTFGIFEFFQ